MTNERQQLEDLLRLGEKYTRSPKTSRTQVVAKWHSGVRRWVKSNSRDSGFHLNLVGIPSPVGPQFDDRPINSREVKDVAQAIGILLRAAERVPSCRDLLPQTKKQVELLREPGAICDSIKALRADFPSTAPLGFLMMRFGQTPAHKAITAAIRSACESAKVKVARADDREYHDDLFWNIATYMHAAAFGVAVLERIEMEDFNPNVSFEVGYMMALGKPVLLLKDRNLKTLHADLVGKLYRPFEPQRPGSTIPNEVNRWLADKAIGVSSTPRITVESAKYGVGNDWMDVDEVVIQALIDGVSDLRVGNDTLGGDPAPGRRKRLLVKLRVFGHELQRSVRESDSLSLSFKPEDFAPLDL
jgi:nucleoside 2-deoxyribosyltransferase